MTNLLSQQELPQWLFAPFLRGIKQEQEFKIGIEIEHFMQNCDKPDTTVIYDGFQGIAQLLARLVADWGWEATYEGSNIIALSKAGNSITIEPSGAVEISSRAMSSLFHLSEELENVRSELLGTAASLGLEPLYFGVHPWKAKEDLPLVPKKRYAFMYNYMGKVGLLGQEMMKLTSSVQVTLDYSSEEDAMTKLRLTNQLTPFFIALSANSRTYRGQDSGFASYRSHIWTDTDNSRSGFPDFLADDLSFEAYILWALDVPVYFLYRNGELIPEGTKTFRELLFSREDLSQSDWETHLSTLFPWVRLRDYLEVRCFDLGVPSLQIGYAALVKGLLYSPESIDSLKKLLEGCDLYETQRLTNEAIRFGLASTQMLEMNRQLLAIAEQGLGGSERTFLEVLRHLLKA